jgi:predicted RNase H-like HicB family nuclease
MSVDAWLHEVIVTNKKTPEEVFQNAYAWLGLWSDFRTLTLAIDPESMARVKALLA